MIIFELSDGESLKDYGHQALTVLRYNVDGLSFFELALLLCAKVGPELQDVLRLFVSVGHLHEFDCQLSDAGNVLCDNFVGNIGHFSKGLQRVYLDRLFLDFNCAEKTVHDEVSLFLVDEILSRLWDRALESFDSDL